MRTITFKGLFLTVLFVLLGNLTILAADEGLITRQITINLDKAGTLPDRISESQKYLITNLKIVGEVNGTDWKFIREMAGRDYNRYLTDGKLSILDLSDAKIVEGGSYYYRYQDVSHKDYYEYTSNDKLGDLAFNGCSGLTSLTLPSNVTSIGRYAFGGCRELTSLTIPSSVTSIGDGAFYDCRGLTSLTIPSSVTSIGESAFSFCSGLTSFAIPSSVTSMGDDAFRGCSGLTSLTIPSSVTSIGEGAFSDCSGLTNLTILSSVASIGKDTFRGCSGLTSLTISSSVISPAFSGCTSLTSLTITSSVTSIGSSAFSGCSGLTSLTIPSSVTSIGSSAFYGCSGLTSLTIPSSVTSIRSGAFSGCSGLTSIYVCPEKLPELGENVFEGCDAKNCTVYVPKGTYDDYRSSEFGYFENIVKLGATGTVITKQITINLDKAGTLPGRISESKKYLITNLKIVGEVNGTDWNFIREMAGCDCKGNTTYGILSILDLSEAKIVEGGSSYIYIGDNIYTSNDKLGDCAFYGCKRLNSLTIPTSVTSIGKEAFSGCSGLNSLNIPTSVTSIGERAFKDCSRLASLTIPSSVTSIGEGAFSSCRGLTSLTIPSSVTWISNCTFEGCSGLTSLTIPSSVTSIGYYAFSGCSGLTSLTIPSSVTEIGCSAFKDCSGLTSIYVYPETSPALGANVFEGCDAKNCTVYVPKGTHDDYWLSDFGYFENLVEFDAAGIDKVTTSTNAKESSRYAVNGQRLSAPAKGLNIVKYSDGSVKKVAVQ